MRIRVAIVCFALASCGPGRWWHRNVVKGPDGTMNWNVVACRYREDCLIEASEGCKFAYEIVDDSQQRRDSTALLVHCLPKGELPAPRAPRQDTGD
jgi:hypothetical protein